MFWSQKLLAISRQKPRIQIITLVGYYLVTCLISWAIWIPAGMGAPISQPLFILAGVAPSTIGLLSIAMLRGRAGVKEILASIIHFGVSWKWYILAIFGPMLLFFTGIGMYWMIYATLPQLIDPAHVIRSAEDWYLSIFVFIYVFIFTALGEEIGWRGFALSRLIVYFGKLRASLLLGLGWAFWHLPLFFIPGNFHQQLPFIWFLLQILASTVIYTWIYQRSQGSLLIVMLFHTGANTAVGLLPVLPSDSGGTMLILWVVVLLECAVAFAILRFDPEMR